MKSSQKNESLPSRPGCSVSERTIERFIDRFTLSGERGQVTECFSFGCCYWFAKILETRFTTEDIGGKAFIVYAPIDNHFGCWINGHVFDITGDVTEDYSWKSWAQYKKYEPTEAARIEKYCIYMEDAA